MGNILNVDLGKGRLVIWSSLGEVNPMQIPTSKYRNERRMEPAFPNKAFWYQRLVGDDGRRRRPDGFGHFRCHSYRLSSCKQAECQTVCGNISPYALLQLWWQLCTPTEEILERLDMFFDLMPGMIGDVSVIRNAIE